MPQILFALFPEAKQAQAASRELSRNAAERPSYPNQIHTRAPLDPNALPELATETGRNTARASVVGLIVGLLLGGIAGATGKIVGLDVGFGGAMGAIFGVLVGLLCGMMAGTKQPRAPLRDAAKRMGKGVMMTIEIQDPEALAGVRRTLAEHGASEIDVC